MAAEKKKKATNPFMPLSVEDKPKACDPVVFQTTRQEWVLVPKSKQVGDDPDNVVLVYEPVMKNEYDLQEYINSFADEVGIQNILKKISMTGDHSLLNQTHREALCPDGGLEPIQDYSNVPQNKTEAFNAVVNGVNLFDQLPDDLKGKLSLTQFVELFGQEEFDNYIQKVVSSLQPKTDSNGGNE